MPSELPPCGLYRTVKAIGEIPAGRLAYFHNHGDPGPGLYFPDSWTGNRAHFGAKGQTVPANFDPSAIKALPREGFYRVTKAFYCCSKNCVEFQPETFVQLGYNGTGQALLFQPELGGTSIHIPERGSAVDDTAFANLVALSLKEAVQTKGEIAPFPRGIVIH
jgi:hypothetical protein